MANEIDIFELDIAKRAIAHVRKRTSDRIGSPNLNKFGKEKPLVGNTPQERPKSAAALKKEYGNGREKSVKQIEREVVGDSIVLKGKVKAMKTAQGNVGQKKQAIKLAPTLTVPMARNSRATNKDGATSFHFKHEAIAKTMHDKVSASGTKTRKNAGRDHSKYLERDSAVARDGDVIDRGTQSEDGRAIADALGQAAKGGLYIEREEALAHQENGVAVIYSNISQDADDRHRFWELVEKHETEPNPDHLKIATSEAPEFWEAVRTDPRCPRQLALAIKQADPAKPYRVRTDDNEYIREIMADHGWAPPMSRGPNETAAEKEERQRTDQLNSKGAHCEDGRGGRIQNRIVGELPYEVSHAQRIRILRKFAAEFEDKNLPYVAVMHAPDHANNDKNWHFHLAYYDRPCSRFTGETEDYLCKIPKSNWRAEAMHELKVKAFASGDLEQYVGQWDFTVPVTQKTKSRNTRISYPFTQDKDRSCTKRGYPLNLRKILAEITNDELEIAGADRRVDPRCFVEMGINKEAEEHLGSRSAQMENVGIATPRGVENEHRQWLHTLDSIDKKLKADQRDTLNEERRRRQTLECHELEASDHSEISDIISDWAHTKYEASELASIASELKKHLERAQSRALKVQETCTRHLAAIEDGTANKRQRDNKTNYLARLVEATDHLRGLTVTMAFEIAYEKQSREDAARLTEKADRLREAIKDRTGDELAAIKEAWANAKMADGVGNNAAPIHLNDDIENEYTSQARTSIETALQDSKNGRTGVAPSAHPNNNNLTSVTPYASVAIPSTQQSAAVPSTKTMAQTLSPTQVMRKIDDIAKAAPSIICVITDGKPFFSLAQQNLEAIGLADGDLTDRQTQLRLGGIHRQMESEINRLVGFIRGSPTRTIFSAPTLFSNNQTIVGLGQNAPPDLRALSLKFAAHPSAQQQMRDAFKTAMAELDKAKAAKETKEQQTKRRPGRSICEAPIERQTANPSDPAPQNAEIATGDRAGEAGHTDVRLGSHGCKPNRSDEDVKASASEPHAKKPATPETVSEQPAEMEPDVEETVSLEAPRQSAIVAAISAEERAELLRPRIFGANGGSKPASIAVSVGKTIAGTYKPSGIPRGLHPKIDAWAQALDSRNRGARQLAALALKNDLTALKLALGALDAITQIRIRKDWEAQLAKNRDKAEAQQQQFIDRTPLL